MTIEELQACLRAAHEQIGRRGRFSFTLSRDDTEECRLTHWVRPAPHAFEDCRVVGWGTLRECLNALDHYVASQAPALAAE